MQTLATRRDVVTAGLLGGLVGALLAAVLVSTHTADAGNGDTLFLGRKNSARANTVVTGKGTFVFDNRTGAGEPAAAFKVVSGPPFRVNSTARVPKLNADRVDGRNADQLVRVAGSRVSDPPDADGPAATATITAPTDGFLVMSGSIALEGTGFDNVQCALTVQAQGVSRHYGHHDVAIIDDSISEPPDDYAVCGTDAVAAVPAGTYEVSLSIFWWSSARLSGATVWVIFVPFDGEGDPPVGPTW